MSGSFSVSSPCFSSRVVFSVNPGWGGSMAVFSIISAAPDWVCRHVHCVTLLLFWLPCPVSCHVCSLWSPIATAEWVWVWVDSVCIWLHWLYHSHNWSLRNKLPGFVYLQLLSSLIQTSIQRCADTVEHSSAGLGWCATLGQSPRSLCPFIHLQSQPLLPLSPAHFFFSVSSNGFMIPPEAEHHPVWPWENASLQTNTTGFEDFWKQASLLPSYVQ